MKLSEREEGVAVKKGERRERKELEEEKVAAYMVWFGTCGVCMCNALYTCTIESLKERKRRQNRLTHGHVSTS